MTGRQLLLVAGAVAFVAMVGLALVVGTLNVATFVLELLAGLRQW